MFDAYAHHVTAHKASLTSFAAGRKLRRPSRILHRHQRCRIERRARSSSSVDATPPRILIQGWDLAIVAFVFCDENRASRGGSVSRTRPAQNVPKMVPLGSVGREQEASNLLPTSLRLS